MSATYPGLKTNLFDYMSTTSKHADSFHAATQIRSLRGRSDDNSFRKATNLGTLSPGRSFSFTAKNSVGLSDTVDYYKFKMLPGVNISTVSQLSATKAGVKLTLYGQIGNGRIQEAGEVTASPSSPFSYVNDVSNTTTTTATVYFKFTPLARSNSNYKLNLFSNF